MVEYGHIPPRRQRRLLFHVLAVSSPPNLGHFLETTIGRFLETTKYTSSQATNTHAQQWTCAHFATLSAHNKREEKVGRVRKATKGQPKREGALWASVRVLKEHATSPSLQCLNCGQKFCGSATQIRCHVVEKCECNTEAFFDFKQKMRYM